MHLCAGTPPHVLEVKPPSGPAVGRVALTVIASNVRENFTVTVGGIPCAALAVVGLDGACLRGGRTDRVGATQLFNVTCTTPALSVGPPRANVTVTNADGTSDTRYEAFMAQGQRTLLSVLALGWPAHVLVRAVLLCHGFDWVMVIFVRVLLITCRLASRRL